jgi:hypothetical protein
MRSIDIIDGVPGATFTADLAALLPVLQKYADIVTQQWSLDKVTLHFAASVREADPNHEWVVNNNRSPDPSMGGFHDIQPNGLPFSRVYAGDAFREGFSNTVDLTHELAEMIVDPMINRQWDDGAGKSYLIEVGDPVEADKDAINVDGVKCSNFVLPAYYGRRRINGGPYDYGRKLTAPCPAMTVGGYVSWLERDSGQWKQAFARLLDGTQSRRSMRYGRSARAGGARGSTP